jgi:hypothetical protein
VCSLCLHIYKDFDFNLKFKIRRLSKNTNLKLQIPYEALKQEF